MNKKYTLISIYFLILAVAIGAFGAHALKEILEINNRFDTFEIASKYHFYNALAILILALNFDKFKNSKQLLISLNLMIIGLIIFSGSLYILSITNIGIFGAITPIGGLFFIISWFVLILALKQN